MNNKSINIAIIILGGTLPVPIFLVGIGSVSEPPTVFFSLLIAVFSYVSGHLLMLRDRIAGKHAADGFSISNRFFGAGRAQEIYVSALSFLLLGLVCASVGVPDRRIEWAGSLPFLIGVGLLGSLYLPKRAGKRD